MSGIVSGYVWQHSQQHGTARLVLLAIADCAHPDGTRAFPTIRELAKKVRVKERTVQYHLRHLEAAGEIISVIRGGQKGERRRANEWRIPMTGAKDDTGQRRRPVQVDDMTGARPRPRPVQQPLHPNVPERHRTGELRSLRYEYDPAAPHGLRAVPE